MISQTIAISTFCALASLDAWTLVGIRQLCNFPVMRAGGHPPRFEALEQELREIAAAFRELPSEETEAGLNGIAEDHPSTKSLYDRFQDAHGKNLFEDLLELCAVAREHRQHHLHVEFKGVRMYVRS